MKYPIALFVYAPTGAHEDGHLPVDINKSQFSFGDILKSILKGSVFETYLVTNYGVKIFNLSVQPPTCITPHSVGGEMWSSLPWWSGLMHYPITRCIGWH